MCPVDVTIVHCMGLEDLVGGAFTMASTIYLELLTNNYCIHLLS